MPAREHPADRSALHPAEYVAADLDGPLALDVHPALVEAGPAHVMWAAWHRLSRRLSAAVEELVEVCDLAEPFAGVEPDGLGVEWPARAYRRWDRAERAGEPATWRRKLAGFTAAAARARLANPSR